jgi:hypothetical protein
MTMTKHITTLLAATLITAPISAQAGGLLGGLISKATSGGSDSKTVDVSKPDATSASGVTMSVDNPEKLKGIKRVAISSFMVDLVDQLKQAKTVEGFELITGAPSEVSIKVIGTDPAHYQAMVDAMYAQAVKDLTAQGFDVISPAELAANADFTKLVANNGENPRRIKSPIGENLYYTAHNLPVVVADDTTVMQKMEFNLAKRKVDPYIGDFSVGINSATNLNTTNQIAKQMNAAMINVRVTLLAAQASIDNSFWQSRSSAKVDAAIGFVPLFNRYLIMLPDGGRARVALHDQVTTGRIGELVNVTSSTTKASELAGNAAHVLGRFGMLGGFSGIAHSSIKYGHSMDFEARMEPDKFNEAVTLSFAKVSASLAAELAHGR